MGHCFGVGVLMAASAVCVAASLEQASRELAQRVALQLSAREPLALDVISRGADTSSEASVRRVFTSMLASRLRSTAEPRALVRITLSENIDAPLLVAELRRGEETSVLFASYLSEETPAVSTGPLLDKRLLWRQEARILDAALLGDTLLILDTGAVTLRQSASPRQVLETFVLPASVAWPRDPRGRLIVSGGSLTVLLPGYSCQGPAVPPWPFQCDFSSAPWPFTESISAPLVAGRNYFSHERLSSFFHAAPLDGGRLAVAGIDGSTRLTGPAGEPVSVIPAGQELAAVTLPCGPALLASTPDGRQLQVFVPDGRGGRLTGSPVDSTGAITALWSSQAASTATLIVREVEHGPAGRQSYAAYLLSLSCR